MGKFKKWPIAYQLYVLAVAIILIISFIFISDYYMISRSLIKNNIVYTTQVFQQIKSNIEDKTELLENLLKTSGYNESVGKYIVEKSNAEKWQLLKELDKSAMDVNQIEKSIQEVIIEGFNNTKYFSNGRTENVVTALKKIPKEPINYYYISNNLTYRVNGSTSFKSIDEITIKTNESDSSKSNSDLSFIISTSIYDVWDTITLPRYAARVSFIVDMDIWGIRNFNDEYNTKILLLDNNNNICATNLKVTKDTEAILKMMKPLESAERQEIETNGTAYIINSNYLSSIGATILSITPKSNIITSISWIGKITFYLLLIALILIIMMFMLFKYNITTPLKKFGVFMKEIEGGNVSALKKQVKLNGYKEIEEIAYQFNSMISEVDSLTHRLVKTMGTLYDTELQKKQAELLHLKSQINPHFLFNTLEVILGISYMENAPKTAEMIKSLSKIFKYCVKGKDTVYISEELNIIKSYVHIQQTRFYDLFEAHYDFEERILDNQIPKMLLQPLVENAVTHGLEKKGVKGNIYIGGKLATEGEIKLWVEDDGAGLNEEKLKSLRNIITQETLKRSDCIGFENVINRLQLIYGDKCKIEISSEENKGTRIEITIPCL